MTDTFKPHAGMPALDASADKVSLFEFWPMGLFYAPVVLYVLWLMIKFRGIMLPTVANPDLPLSGLVGEEKARVLDQVSGDHRDLIAPYKLVRRTGGTDGMAQTVTALQQGMSELNLDFPVVLKPNIGMRGAGVQVARRLTDLENYGRDFPAGGDIMLQYLIPHIGEAGVFYVRRPGENTGRITSLTLKYFPTVTGDGNTSLRNLILATPRAGKLLHLYADRFGDQLDKPVEAGRTVKLAFAGNHSKGTIFRNGNAYITSEMTAVFDQIAKSLGEFYVGRFDVRFACWDRFQKGQGFMILEINGAGGESTHIWDSRTGLFEAWGTLMRQYRWIFEIGAWNRRRGFKPSSPSALYRAWRHELKISKHYPVTH